MQLFFYYFKILPITGTSNTYKGYSGNFSNVVSTSTVNGTALTPTFGSNTSTSGGFTGSVTNYNSSWTTWNIATSAGSVSWGTPSGSSYPFTVTGLSSGQSATVTVTTLRSGYNTGSAQTTGTAATLPSPPTITSSSSTTTSITGIGAVRTNNTAPYVTWNIVGINIQSSRGTVIYGSTTPPSIISGTDPQANTALQRATNSRSGGTANYYRYNSVTAFSGTGQSGRSTATISTTTIVQANANATTTVYGTYP